MNSKRQSEFDKLRNQGIPVGVGGVEVFVKEPLFKVTWQITRKIIELLSMLKRDERNGGEDIWEMAGKLSPQQFGIAVLREMTSDDQLEKVYEVVALVLDKEPAWVSEHFYTTDIPEIISAVVEVYHPSFFVEAMTQLKEKFPSLKRKKKEEKDGGSESSSEPTPNTVSKESGN